MKRLHFVLLLFVFESSKLQSQDFNLPIKEKCVINSNFGEIRPNHFHAGLDIQTPPNKSLPIHAIEEGFISRIRVGTRGYGKAIYISHPNGKTSVYAHLNKFSDKIWKFIQNKQRDRKTFEIDFSPQKHDLPISKDELIGYSGNTGNSTGPHLHFEIRDSKNDAALNPLLYYDFSDTLSPQLKEIYFFKLEDLNNPDLLQSVSGARFKQNNKKMKNIMLYSLLDTIRLENDFGIAVSASDKLNSTSGQQQVYAINILLNKETFFSVRMDSLPFEETKYINCFTQTNGELKAKKIMKCFLNKNQELAFIKDTRNRGFFNLKSNEVNEIQIELCDVKMNKSIYTFKVIQKNNESKIGKSFSHNCKEENRIIKESVSIIVPEKAAFNDFDIYIRQKSVGNAFCKNEYTIEGLNMPLNKSLQIGIKPDVTNPVLLEKLFIYNTTSDSYCGGKLNDGKIFGESKSFGNFSLKIDSVGPKINPLPVTGHSIKFHVTDTESGISDFRMYINGEWVYSEYEHKENVIYHIRKNDEQRKKSIVRLEVTDNRNNTSIKEIELK